MNGCVRKFLETQQKLSNENSQEKAFVQQKILRR